MTTVQRRRRPTSAIVSKARQYLMLNDEAKQLKTRTDDLKSDLMGQIVAHGSVDEVTGHTIFAFPEEINTGRGVYSGLKREKRVAVVFDEDIAEAVLKSKGDEVYQKAVKMVPTLDQDEVYALHMADVITEAEMDSILVKKETFAFVPVKG